jgi:hypothetical protein
MHAIERPVECRPRLLARIIVVRADLFNDDLALNAHVLCLQERCKRNGANQPRRVNRGCSWRMDPIDRALSIGPRI